MAAKSISTRPEATAGEHFLPNFCAMRMVFAVVITAELLSMVLVLGSGIFILWQRDRMRRRDQQLEDQLAGVH